MKQVVATALVLLLILFLLPMLLLGGEPLSVPDGEGTPMPTGTLPIDHTVVSPPPAAGRDAGVSVRVAMADGTVEELSMEDYLWGVVAAEMPASFEPEALKAQTVAARTYTAAKMGHTVQTHPDADVCTDITCCQAYLSRADAAGNWGDKAQAYTRKIADAVSATDGMILAYQGAPIQAVFFSSAAGKTVDAVEVWGNSVPYLTSVDSPEGEEDVPNYHSTVTVPLEEFRTKLLAAHSDADLSGEPSGWFAGIVHNSGGGVEHMDVGGVTVRGSELRTLFSLRSTSFTVAAGAQGVSFSVTGYGHGVGMSQYGANAMAKAGKTWQDIVTWYYSGVEITQMQ